MAWAILPISIGRHNISFGSREYAYSSLKRIKYVMIVITSPKIRIKRIAYVYAENMYNLP